MFLCKYNLSIGCHLISLQSLLRQSQPRTYFCILMAESFWNFTFCRISLAFLACETKLSLDGPTFENMMVGWIMPSRKITKL